MRRERYDQLQAELEAGHAQQHDQQDGYEYKKSFVEFVELWQRLGQEGLARQKILSYFRNNLSRMYYGSYRRQGLLIGSGPIEAVHRNVIQQRLKLAGQRWTQAGGSR